MKLRGKRIAILIAPRGTEDPEFAKPKLAIEAEGAEVTVIGLEDGQVETVNNDLDAGSAYPVDKAVANTSAGEYDGLIVPGGCVGADKLRASKEAIAFIRDIFNQGKPVAAICHAPWTLIEADVLKGRILTSYPTLKTDIRNAGGVWVDLEVCVDGKLVTSRNPHDLPAFCAKMIDVFGNNDSV